MAERIIRDGDRKVYNPRIHSDRINDLYTLKEETGLPMTVLLDLAIRMLIDEMRDKEWEGKSCGRCGPGARVVYRAITDRGIEYLCNPHHFILNELGVIKFDEPGREESARMEAEWNMENKHDDLDSNLNKWSYTDYWEDGERYFDGL